MFTIYYNEIMKDQKLIPATQIVKEFKVPYRTLYHWIRTGKLPAYQNIDKFNPKQWYIDENDWFEIPTFIRNRYKLNNK